VGTGVMEQFQTKENAGCIIKIQWNTLNRIALKGIFQIKEYSF
jgi:hypothetical protein